MGDVLPPLHSPYAALKAMQFPPQQKPRKLRGLPLNCSKKYPLPVNGCHCALELPSAPCRRSGLPFFGVLGSGPDCTASPVRDE